MTPRERWKAVIEGRSPDRPPCDYWATAEVTARLRRDLNCSGDRALWQCLGVDKCIHLAPRHPRAAETDWHLQSWFSIWGIATREIGYGSGVYREVVSGPLPADVAREVQENLRFFSACKGYIVAPCHNIQANIPTENILALYETVRNGGMP